MKQFKLTIAILMASSATFAQNCKYKTNEMDKFTGKYTKVTKSEQVIGTFYTSGVFSVRKEDTAYSFILDYNLSSYSNFDPYTIQLGAKIIFLLENGEAITLNSSDNIKGVKKTTIGLPPVYSCALKNVNYNVTRSQLDSFFKSKVKSIRFYRTEDNGKETYVDNEIKSKNQNDIQELIKCVL